METPVLFLIFNRPDLTSRVFAQLKKAKPAKLYIAADGPRPESKYDHMRCVLTRDVVLKNIDWECEVKTLLRDDNLGCGLAVSDAITWFFSHEEEGIILEDDCLPDDSFFDYCSAMLKRYRHDERVMQIQGFSMLVHSLLVKQPQSNSVHATRIPNIWGWATWRRAWDSYCYDIEDIDFSNFADTSPFPDHIMESIFTGIENFKDPTKRPDLWDIQWCLLIYARLAYSIFPTFSLVENIGFTDGTHMTNGNYYFQNRPASSIDYKSLTVKDDPEQMINDIYDSHVLEIVIMRRRIRAGKSPYINSNDQENTNGGT